MFETDSQKSDEFVQGGTYGSKNILTFFSHRNCTAVTPCNGTVTKYSHQYIGIQINAVVSAMTS